MALTKVTGGVLADDAVGVAGLSATGTASASTFLRGDNAWASAAAGLNSIQVFTSSGTWTRPTGITKVVMEVQGGGAGGGRSNTSNICMGGSGGGYAKKLLDVSSISTSTITIGSAGVGATTDAAGTDGGDSIWADGTNTITGVKGVGGNTTQTYTIGGLGTGGDINIQGGKGRKGQSGGGGGGGSQLGRLGPSADGAGNPVTNTDASGYGSGGGAVELASIARAGNGTPGIIIVTEYK